MKTIVSYPDRGTGGNNKHLGNCSPNLINDLVEQFRSPEISDYMKGGDTMRRKKEKPLSLKVRARKPLIKTYTRVHRDRKNAYQRTPKHRGQGRR